MIFTGRIFVGIISLTILGSFLLWPGPSRPTTTAQRAPQAVAAPAESSYNFQNSLLGRALNGPAQAPNQQGPTVGQPVTPGISPAARDLVAGQAEPVLDRELNPRQNPSVLDMDPNNPDPYDTGEPDPLVQRSHNRLLRTPALSTTFEGISLTSGGAGVPPDTVGDVGPNHYVQMVNSSFQIFDKNGNSLAGPTNINQLWTGQGDSCEAQNLGDPIVLYDRQADRWLLSQFFANGLCIAISQTADPAGAYYLYTFPTTLFPDYPKFGVWGDAYYMGSNEASYTAYAFDRANMLIGATARPFVRFAGQANFLMPADLDGATAPPANTPGLFYTFKDDGFHGGSDRLEIYEFKVDFDTPGNSTFTLAATINISNFTYTVCGFFNFNCVPQPGTGQKVDSVSEWPMWRLQYRNFDSYQTLAGNFTVDVGGDQAGIRWFELRKSGGGNWTLYQEGTHAPDSDNRWMGSIAMDQSGNMALGYSVSSSSTFPSIRYATRLATDTLGTFQTEETLIAGGGSQTGANRWGDYSSMNVDPADDCAFWYTNEYYSTNSPGSWQTRVGAFRIPSCGPELVISKSGPSTVIEGNLITYTLTVTNSGTAVAKNLVITDSLPAGANYVSGGTLAGDVVSLTVASLAANNTATQTTFVVTATQVITNEVYGVVADGGVSARGSTVVRTDVVSPVWKVYLPLLIK